MTELAPLLCIQIRLEAEQSPRIPMTASLIAPAAAPSFAAAWASLDAMTNKTLCNALSI
jgi:hypothetical protein